MCTKIKYPQLKHTKKLLAVLVSVLVVGCKSESDLNGAIVEPPLPRPIKLMKLKPSGFENVQHFPATITANQEVELSFQVSGLLKKFDIKPGDTVKKGQLLAAIDDRDYRNQLAMRAADHQLAQMQFNRISNLLDKKMISHAEFDNASAQLKAAEASLRLAQDQVKDTRVFAPFSGQIAATMTENYQYIQPQQTLLLLQDSEELNVAIQLPASILNNLHKSNVNPNYQPTLLLNGKNQTHAFPITYKQHSTQASLGTQSYEVVFSLQNPEDLTLYAGMGATVSIDFNQAMTTTKVTDYYQVPLNAVIANDALGTNQVWAFNPSTNTISAKNVSIGEIVGDSIFISGDLQPNDLLAASGLTSLTEGMLVKPLVRERGL
ncbi:multidrug resistance protein [Vibrio comitans NBRC 102076]|uniref:Multidrug resistance protein n=2 Tax=Vibrio comitans TaxID=413401 RepID=A0A4Y3IQS1_9VIBR|nr:multidrug resistance protein [Vibrio comitans NBRC 102076]